MIKLIYAPIFIRQLGKLGKELQNEAIEKIGLFEDESNHKALKVHKLHGSFKNKYSFSVNYKYRIVFMWQSKSEAALLAIGDHAIYK
jgi:plasmid maintenance system killer protein